jgi:hypothetical protein
MTDNVTIVAVLGIILGCMAPVLLVGCILFYKHRKLRLTHETIIRLAEKGAPIPPEMLAQHCETRSSDLRRGTVLSLVGVALAIFLSEVGAPWSLGLIPMFAGIGYLITWKLEGRSGNGGPIKPVAQV